MGGGGSKPTPAQVAPAPAAGGPKKPPARSLTRSLTRVVTKPAAAAAAAANAVASLFSGEDTERIEKDNAATAAVPDNLAKYMNHVRCIRLFAEMGEAEIEAAARQVLVKHFKAGEIIFDEGQLGHECWVVEEGVCFASKYVWSMERSNTKEWKETRTYKPGKYGSYFGEKGLIRSEPRDLRITCRTDVKAVRISAESYVTCARIREAKENMIRKIELFAQMTDDQVGKLGQILETRKFSPGETFLQSDAAAECFFMLESGEAADDDGTTKYAAGAIIGERILSEEGPYTPKRAVVASTDVVAYAVSKVQFEERLGKLQEMQKAQFEADPRKLLADFFQPGDASGPLGLMLANGSAPPSQPTTQWFAVYRPCSRDSIAKMLGNTAVGKGLNIKGKSAKKNKLSGFVPFLQVSDNAHKKLVEPSPKDARTHIYYRNVIARQQAESTLTEVMRQTRTLQIDDAAIHYLSRYEPDAFGLDIPEGVVREAYIMQPDLSPIIGWETGRASEPAFMDMNLHSVRGSSSPTVCLIQSDLAEPMNPHGLLISYAEDKVKPVASDFDTFTVGSKGMRYEAMANGQMLGDTQADHFDLMNWSLDQAQELIANPNQKGWMSRWLEVLKKEAAPSKKHPHGFHPTFPKFGFGDPTSYGLIDKVVGATRSCGAVRHGAECYNFYFPQDLDDQFLVVWDGFKEHPPWRSVTEPQLRQFLLDRCKDGYSFPINLVWPIRDPGWYEVLQALRANADGQANLPCWFPPESKVLERVDQLHAAHPEGFKVLADAAGAKPKLEKGGSRMKSMMGGAMLATALLKHEDLDTREMAMFGEADAAGEVKIRWRKVRNAVVVEAALRKGVGK